MKKVWKSRIFSAAAILVFIFEIIKVPGSMVYAQKNKLIARRAPLSTAFMKYINKGKLNILKDSAAGESEKQKDYGHVVSPKEKNLYFSKKGHNFLIAKVANLPSKYDLREQNRVTPVRNQGKLNGCWSFAAYGSIESNLLPKEKDDFSEANLMNTHGFDLGPNDGGNVDMAIAYLGRWDGPISEKDDRYTGKVKKSPSNLKTQKHIQNADYITGDDIDTLYSNIKNAVMNTGAVDTSMYYADRYYDAKHHSYYCGDGYKNYDANHDVTIVGWDDNFSRHKFVTRKGEQPSSNGAFIIKNSWGKAWGDKGYFYISYEDAYAFYENVAFDDVEDINNYSSEYSYDPLGDTSSMVCGYDPNEDGSWTSYGANVFTADSNQSLSAVGFFTEAPNTSYEIQIYDTANGNSFSGLEADQSGTIAYMGYHTIKLNSNVQLFQNRKFVVSIKFTTPPDYEYPIPIETPIRDYSSKASSSIGESYVSSDGANWYDLDEDNDFYNTNVCIRAFTDASN